MGKNSPPLIPRRTPWEVSVLGFIPVYDLVVLIHSFDLREWIETQWHQRTAALTWPQTFCDPFILACICRDYPEEILAYWLHLRLEHMATTLSQNPDIPYAYIRTTTSSLGPMIHVRGHSTKNTNTNRIQVYNLICGLCYAPGSTVNLTVHLNYYYLNHIRHAMIPFLSDCPLFTVVPDHQRPSSSFVTYSVLVLQFHKPW